MSLCLFIRTRYKEECGKQENAAASIQKQLVALDLKIMEFYRNSAVGYLHTGCQTQRDVDYAASRSAAPVFRLIVEHAFGVSNHDDRPQQHLNGNDRLKRLGGGCHG